MTPRIEFLALAAAQEHRVQRRKVPRLRYTAAIDRLRFQMAEYEPLDGGKFFDSFLIEVNVASWPNDYEFLVWSTVAENAYRILARPVLEFHYMRSGTGILAGLPENGLPLSDIYRSQGDEYDYWMNQIAAFQEEGADSGEPPICLVFDSPFFLNRKRQLFVRDRDIGMLVVCRSVAVERDDRYSGPRPFPFKISAGD